MLNEFSWVEEEPHLNWCWAQKSFLSGWLTFFSIFIIAKWLRSDLPTYPNKNYKAFFLWTRLFSRESNYVMVSEWFLLALYKYFNSSHFENTNMYVPSFRRCRGLYCSFCDYHLVLPSLLTWKLPAGRSCAAFTAEYPVLSAKPVTS